MLYYDMHKEVEAFTTNKSDALDFEVVLPEYQAHSTEVAVMPREADQTYGRDALITDKPGLRIGIKTADCVPVLLYDPAHKAAAAIHSGWKGTLSNICAAAVAKMTAEYGTCPADLIAVIGPCIHQEAFEVGDDLYESFVNAGYEQFAARMPRFATKDTMKWHLDLPGICRTQLQQLGVAAIETREECTYTLHNRFYSARRLGSAFGTQRIITCIKIL